MLSHSAHGSRGIIAVLSLTLSVATIIGCGGGGSSTTPSASPTPTPTPTPSVSPSPIASPAVSLTADSQDLLRGQSTRLVWNSQNTSAVAESNFDATTLAGEKIVTPLATTTYSLTVRNEGGQTVVGSVEVRVATVAITAFSSSPTVDVSSSLTFGAQVTGAVDAGVTWSVQELGGGVITESGSYTAPATAGTYHVQATSNADPSKVAVVEVRVRAASGSVTVN
ncbi:MAG: hypothetical protein H8F28_15075 [Fibrella sp.]|nr:hypothetical protein [Armatimonadota bacterium]